MQAFTSLANITAVELPKEKKAPARNVPRHTTMWDAAVKISNQVITSGGVYPLLGAAIAISLGYFTFSRLSSEDTRLLIEHLADSKVLSIGGWVLFAGSTVISIKIVAWLKTSYELRIDKLEKTLDRYLPSPSPQELFTPLQETKPTEK